MPEVLDPKKFVITRKRKKYKFAKFHNAPNCFEMREWDKRHVDVVEVGAGTGLFAVNLAERHPDKVYVAVDVKGDRLQKGAYEALERGLDNIFFIRARADQLEELFAPSSLRAIWLTFPDPYPKKRAAGRRLSHPTFLRTYQNVLHTQGILNLKHDNPDFFMWSLEQLVVTGWHIVELTFDLHESTLSEEYKILTSYEQRWLSEGRASRFVSARYAGIA